MVCSLTTDTVSVSQAGMERVPGEIIMGLITVIIYNYNLSISTKSSDVWENLTCEGVLNFYMETYSEVKQILAPDVQD